MTTDDVEILLARFLDLVGGDVNLDGMVDASDMNILGQNWLKTGMGWGDGDFNGDGTVNAKDLTILAENWQWGV